MTIAKPVNSLNFNRFVHAIQWIRLWANTKKKANECLGCQSLCIWLKSWVSRRERERERVIFIIEPNPVNSREFGWMEILGICWPKIVNACEFTHRLHWFNCLASYLTHYLTSYVNGYFNMCPRQYAAPNTLLKD